MNDTGQREIIKKDTNPKVAGILSSDQIVKIIFSNTDSIFEKRLQSVAYLSELEWLINYNNSKQLSTVTYIRTPKSIFSDSIRDSIDNINNHFSRVAYDNGYRTEKWYVEQVNFTKSELESEKQKQAYDCITEIQNKSVDLSPDYLQKLCRNFNITDVNTGDRISLDRLI